MSNGIIEPFCAVSNAAQLIRDSFAQCGVSSADLDEIDEARDFAARLIGGKVTSAQTIARVHDRTGAALFLTRDGAELTGLLAFVLLSEQGLTALWADRFDGLEPDPDHVAGDGKPPAAVYNWGIAASRFRAVKRLIDGYQLMRRSAVPHLAFFGRPVTEQGRRLTIDRLQFKPVPGSRTGLVWIEPINQQASAVAA
jgi:hypothetical protein